MSWQRIRYRAGQFLRQAQARVEPEELRLVEQVLPPTQAELFRKMPAASQRHSLNVYYALRQAGEDDGELLRAALLHDVGKRGVRLYHRVANVLLRALAPRLWRRWATLGPGPGRGGLYTLRHHGELGAKQLVSRGASRRIVEIVRLHQEENLADPKLRRFRQADEAN